MLCRPQHLRHNASALPRQHKSSHGQNANKCSWLPNNPAFTRTGCSTVHTNNKVILQWERSAEAFSKEDTQMTNKHVKTCSMSLVISEMQMKTKWNTILHSLGWYHQKDRQQQVKARMWISWNLYTLLVRICNQF